jgi:hypothetical protein
MIYILSIILGTLAIIFLVPLRNEVGALIMGLDAAGIDFCLQWLRIKFSGSDKAKYLGLVIFGGLAARAASVFVFIKAGGWWFGFNTSKFYIFAVCLLAMIPVLSFIVAYKFKPQRD